MLLRTFLSAALMLGLSLSVTAEEPKEVTIKALKLQVPTGWTQKEASNRLRLAEFTVPVEKGEEEAELVVYSFGGGGGGVDANISRWVKQFDADGRKAKVTAGKAPQGEYVLVDISGTYNMPIGPPIQQKTKAAPNSRMLAVILDLGDEGNYFLKLTGGKETVAKQVDNFRSSFGGSADSEKAYEK